MKKLLIVLALVVAACGKRGDPHPPVPVIPRATSDLLVTQRGNKVILSWSYPSLTTAGRSLISVRRVAVYRYVEPLPAPDAVQPDSAPLPGDVDTTKPRPLALFAKIPPVTPAAFNKLKQQLDTLDAEKLPSATVGAKLQFEDAPPFHDADGRPVRLTYAVVTFGESARSDLSNLAAIVPIDVPVAPANLNAAAKPQGVVLTWTPPATSATAHDKPFLAGYNIYRVAASAQFDEATAPVNAAPVSAATFTDTPPYGEYRYRVTALAVPGTPRIESEPSDDVTVAFKDLLPPPAPATVSALVEPKSVRLIWDAVESADFAGYKVYRTEGMGHEDIKEIGTTPLFADLLTVTTYVDPTPNLGIAYKYGVSAFDKNGNESARVWTGWVVVPKTP